jgi:hypothetical protein
MAFLNREQALDVVVEALEVIADIPEDVEELTFTSLNDRQDHIFLSALKSKLNALPYNMNNGTTTFLAYYDVDLHPDSIDEWETVGACADWIVDNQRVVYLN